MEPLPSVDGIMYVILVNGEPRLRHEASEVRQLRSELLAMRDIDLFDLTQLLLT